MDKYKLCYISGDWAYFTTQNIKDQWGDDWDDAPYEHNAGEPYDYYEKTDKEPYEIIKVAFISDHDKPCDRNEYYMTSVRQINEGVLPWLIKPNWWSDNYGVLERIYAGESFESFIEKIIKSGGEVYTKYK